MKNHRGISRKEISKTILPSILYVYATIIIQLSNYDYSSMTHVLHKITALSLLNCPKCNLEHISHYFY